MAVIFDKLAYVRRLEQDGNFNRPQAEALSEALHDAVRESVATKQDVAEFRAEVSAEMAALRQEIAQQSKDLRQEIAQQSKDLRQEIAQQSKDLRQEVAQQSKDLRHEITQQGKDLRAHTDLQISQLKIWIMGGLLTSVVAVVGAVIAAFYGLMLPALRARGVVP